MGCEVCRAKQIGAESRQTRLALGSSSRVKSLESRVANLLQGVN